MPAAEEPVTRHATIAESLRAQIRSGAVEAGAPLPSEAELSARFGVSRGTVRQALAGLRADGLIEGGRGRRPVVARPVLAQSFDEMVSFTAWALELGRRPAARTLELTRRPATLAVARSLELATGAPVFEYRRVRLLDDEPVMVEHSTFVEDVGRLLLDCDTDAGSVYQQLGERGVRFAEASQSITAVAATVDQADLLGVPRRAPLLAVTRRVLDLAGRPIELSVDSYRADTFAITVHHRIATGRAGVGLRLVGG